MASLILRTGKLKSSFSLMCFHLIFLVLTGCTSPPIYLDRYAADSLLPRSTEFLSEPDFRSLRYYILNDDLQNPDHPGIVYETWGDERFVANANLSMRYRHVVRSTGKVGDQEYFPVGVSIDFRCPLDSQHRNVALTWIHVLERHFKKPLHEVFSAVDQFGSCAEPGLRVLPFESVVAEVSVGEVRQRGILLSISFYAKSYYEKHLQPVKSQ